MTHLLLLLPGVVPVLELPDLAAVPLLLLAHRPLKVVPQPLDLLAVRPLRLLVVLLHQQRVPPRLAHAQVLGVVDAQLVTLDNCKSGYI